MLIFLYNSNGLEQSLNVNSTVEIAYRLKKKTIFNRKIKLTRHIYKFG